MNSVAAGMGSRSGKPAALRADRLATISLFHPVRRILSPQSGIPILMYHSIGSTTSNHRHPYFETSTSPEEFERQIRFLRDNGYKTIALPEVLCGESGERRVVITFDDGFEDFYTKAAPILAASGFTATMFLATGYIGDPPFTFKGIRCLSWPQVRELQQAGMTFGSHTVTHPQLCKLSPGAVKDELRISRESIEQHLGCAADSFSYPYAFPEADIDFKKRFRAALIEAGYRSGVSTSIGIACDRSDPLFLERLPVNTWDDPALFRAKLEGGYNWLGTVQHASKWVSRLVSTDRAGVR
jgi:peptidoglycan/xylan/chitin deacetylase (PgdA/CDA1 family)